MGVENIIPEGWVECTLGEVISTNDESLSKNYPHQEIIYIDTGSVTKNKIEAYQVFNLKEAPTRAKRLVRDGDIIYSTVRPDQEHYGYLVSPQINCVVSTGFCVIRAKNDSDSKFIYYFLTQRSVTKFLHTIGEQNASTYPSINPDDIEKLVTYLPHLPEQKAIAKVLTAFDDKIELLQAQNKTLETMAQTIFKEWFGKYQIGDELPEGWRVGKLGEIASIKSGFAFKSKDFVEEGNMKALKIKDLKGDGKVSLHQLSSVSKDVTASSRVQYFKLEQGDIVIAMSGNTTGKIGVIPPHSEEVYLNQRVGKFFMIKEELNSFLYAFLMSGNYEEKILSMGYGSAQPNISPSQIESIDMIYPNEVKLLSFLNISKPIFGKVLYNNDQIQSLTKTRDTLLPKLMSGQVRVKNIKHTADA